MKLRKGSMMVKKYCLMFTHLSKYDLELLANSRARMRKFTTGVSNLVVNECRTSMMIKDMDISRFMTHG